MKISISDSAFRDLEGIKEYYLEEGIAHIGSRIISAIVEHIETLHEHPDIGRVVPEFGEKKIRELIHPPYRIVYLRGQQSIHVIRVWRSERLLVLPVNET